MIIVPDYRIYQLRYYTFECFVRHTQKESNDITIKNTPIKILIKHELNIIIHGTDKIKYRNHLRHDTRVYILTEY